MTIYRRRSRCFSSSAASHRPASASLLGSARHEFLLGLVVFLVSQAIPSASHDMGAMDTIFSTAGLHPRDRFDCWHEVACKQVGGHQSRPLTAAAFEAELQAAPLADVQLLTFRNSPMDVSRTRRDIARARSDELFVCRQIAGSLALEQQGREITLTKGDFCLLDPQLPSRSGASLGACPARTAPSRS